MANRFFEDEDICESADTNWRVTLAEELRQSSPFGDLHAAPVYSTPEIYLYHKEHFRPYGAKLVLQMGKSGLSVGFYIERGYLWAAEAGWTLQPHWDWHHFMYLLGNDPGFVAHFKRAREAHESFAFWIRSGESDAESISLHASHLPLAALLGLLGGWPGHLWCDVYFAMQIPRDVLLGSSDDAVLERIIGGLRSVEPIYRAVLERKMAVEARIATIGE